MVAAAGRQVGNVIAGLGHCFYDSTRIRYHLLILYDSVFVYPGFQPYLPSPASRNQRMVGIVSPHLAHANVPARFQRYIHDPRYWFEDVIGPDAVRLSVPVSVSGNDGERPCCGFTWVFPPTLANPNETTRSSRTHENQQLGFV